jgi:hypothetical protein
MLVRMKLQVPFRIPETRDIESPVSPSRSADGSLEPQVDAACAGERQELGPVVGDELLVRGHDRLARRERPPDPRAGRLETAHELHDDVDVRGEDVVGVLGPRDVARNPGRPLPGDVAVEDVRQTDAWRRLFSQDPGDGLPHGAESEKRHARGSRRCPGPLGDHLLEPCIVRNGRRIRQVYGDYRKIRVRDGLTSPRHPCDTLDHMFRASTTTMSITTTMRKRGAGGGVRALER